MPGLPATSKPDRESAADSGVTSRAKPRRQRRDRQSEDETFTLGRYVITDRIASGGMATVYRARLEGQGGFAREFAIKVVHPHLAAAEGFRERFLDEARVASRVNHPNVVATIDSDQDRGYHFLVLELVDGITLRQLLVNDLHRSSTSEGARLSPGEAARVVCDAARGLHAVHSVVDDEGVSLDVVHRDLSPHNLMLDATGRTVLIDLGLAKARGQLGHTQTGVLCGKLPYMSPEQSRVEPLDARSDVFSLGSVLFELACGEAPFGDDHTPGTLDALRTCDPDRLARKLVDADVPSWLTQIVLACLRRDPEDRYASAAALADALDDAMRRAGIIQSESRQKLSARAQTVRARLGPEHPADPLPPLISPDPTGPHRAVATGSLGTRIPSWLQGLGMASAGAVLVLVGLFVVETVESRAAATVDDATWLPSLAADANLRQPLLEPAPTRAALTPPAAPSPRAPAPEPEPDLDGGAQVEDFEPEPEPARKPKRGSSPKRDPLAEFKSNPYD
jgi:eukaryotic-like serine/threonine-protein kinase